MPYVALSLTELVIVCATGGLGFLAGIALALSLGAAAKRGDEHPKREREHEQDWQWPKGI